MPSRFGLSTHLFHESRLERDHLRMIADHGFDAVEVFATRSHFDYVDAGARDELATWLADTGLALHSVHAPIVDAMRGGAWVGSYSTAAATEQARRAAIDQAKAALELARVVPFQFLVAHLGVPRADADNQPGAARRSVEELAEAAAAVGVRLALEVIPNRLSSPDALVHLLEEELDLPQVGICLDYGHAHLLGDVPDAIETISGHLLTTHVHDNHGSRDDHLVPGTGSIDWEQAMMATQKIGYDGVLVLEVANSGEPGEVLRRSVRARERLERTFVTF